MGSIHLTLLALAALGTKTLAAPSSNFIKRASIASIPSSAWDALNASVNGNLHYGEPMLAPCYARYDAATESPNLDIPECLEAQTRGGDLTYSTSQFGSYVNSQWGGCQRTGESCTFGAIRPDILTPVLKECKQGSVPSLYVDVRSVEDVQRTMEFASRYNVRLVVKNTGHDYMGRSSAPDSLALWMHNLQPPIDLDETFSPDNCAAPAGPAITFGAGQQFGSIYDFVEERGYRIVGGSSYTVGAAGGWITGGGHSVLTNELGLGVDNVLQLRAVLPNGTHITANRCQNQDLFFALRGGGGGNFAVITEMTSKVHPKKTMQFVTMTFTNIGPIAQARLMEVLVENAEKWAGEGWGGYINAFPLFTNLFLGTALLDHGEAKESMKPLSDFATLFNLGIVSIKSTDSFKEGLDGFVAIENLGIAPGSAWALSSRILRKESFAEEKQANLSSILTDFLQSTQRPLEPSTQILVLCLTMPTLYSENMPESDKEDGPGYASISPHWRDGIWQALHFRSYDGTITDPGLVTKIAQNAHDAMQPLREFAPDSAVYMNEADPWEPDHVNAFWGQENYDRLLRIKREVDPQGVLRVWKGVGWEEFGGEGEGRYECYPDVEAEAWSLFRGF
ncbi:uncharacterized protein DSM5745_04454 [Aspergillus mulundensis]|uniref:FAD-binding PCMH-type domain-containing protein n=1 Tax=Aspergillus mulundensis TaxID=1810919 RepID=A0A3D8SEE6_9EURO|nr:Uncharacterized protein DSM5745_04454 [Aspergillus mulundensis]RDW84128.1 Uncharacterized protein DSM5745_04454 [Aspergillus mulundensis]